MNASPKPKALFVPVNDFSSNILQDLLRNSVHVHQANLSGPAPERKTCVAIGTYRVDMRRTVIVREDNDSVGADAEHRGHMTLIVTQPLGFHNAPIGVGKSRTPPGT
jgi:hypothetical protein